LLLLILANQSDSFSNFALFRIADKYTRLSQVFSVIPNLYEGSYKISALFRISLFSRNEMSQSILSELDNIS